MMQAEIWFPLICCIFGITGFSRHFFAAAQNGCGLKMPTDLPPIEPVLLHAESSSASFSLFRPTGEDNQLAKGSRLLLLCSGYNNVIETLNQQIVELYCRADGKFATVVDDVEYNLSELGCSSIPASNLRLTNVPCAAGKGTIFEAGFDYGDDSFATVFKVCYNNETEHTYYAYNLLNGATINYSVTQSTRRAFRADGMHFSTTATNKFYTINNQIERFEAYFGPSQPFITRTSFLARGHMAPDADFIFSYEQLATYFYVNCAPEFQVINAGNWIRVENLARNLAGNMEDDLEIYTGTMGLLRLSDGAKQNVEIYLDNGKFIEAPLHYFKVIRHAATDAAIVMITVNNPFATSSEITEMCENVCERAGVANPIFADTSRGYTYCCELSAFKQIYADLPADLTATKLLNEPTQENPEPNPNPNPNPNPSTTTNKQTSEPVPAPASASATGCTITMPTDIPRYEPVYFIKADDQQQIPKLFKPKGEVTTIPADSKLILACVGYENNLELLGQQSIELTCKSDGTFFSSEKSQTYSLSQLNCESIPTPEIDLTSNECGGSSQAFQFEAGYPWETYFGGVFTICYDNTTERTLYSRNIINGATINYKIIESTRRAFRANGMQYSTTAVNKFYTKNNQIAVFKSYFGASQPYITRTSFLARGHLSPDADFVFSYEQLATYFYANVAPEFQVVNAGNWIRVENAARNLAASFGSDLLTFTGYLGILELPKTSNQMQAIYIDSEKHFPAPQWFYKILMHPNLPKSVVMITSNNPFANSADIQEFCTNVCTEYGLESPFFTDISRGYTFCCTLDDFQQAVPNLPTFDLPSGW